ncbi:linear amide C-N hydrolase [Vibrio splendidus]|uniref:linear amide C-N hydrolase n=1 Tax=Vibrio splendidus TaxID=29497 RepID=UPI000C85788C|nr:linear amide C-N hydrolase [Vibrio splendidus]PMI76227.1 hydrolase [Vibrio splendidus]PMK57349.1 hydrolase [Vibrio splendidus]
MCTRIIYETNTGKFITGRGMDWNDPTAKSRVVVYPRGLKQTGGDMDNALTWTSKYGSIFSSFYDAASSDGMNECGLVANTLYLAEADYGDVALSEKPRMSIGAWNQYFLDNFATVAEAVEAMQDVPFIIAAPMLPNGRAAAVHLAISDVSGDSAVFEYIDGDLVIYHSKAHRVMTNSPTFDQQLAINNYWEIIGGNRMLPGTISAADRFVRVNYLLKSTPKFDDGVMATSAAMSIMRSIGVPLGMEDPDHPNISATLWRSLGDHEAKRYYFESSIQPAIFWLDIDSVNLEVGAPIMSVEVNGPESLFGDVTEQLKPLEKLTWL